MAFTAWLGGQRRALIVAALAALSWTEADTTSTVYSHPGYAAWNAGTHLLWFAAAAAGLGRLRDALDEANTAARTDGLTGVANRRCFREHADLALHNPGPVTLVYIDVDGFKAVNDARGHAEGDELLRAIARTLRGVVRQGDALARLGGDEFAILLPGADAATASDLLDRVRRSLTDLARSQAWLVTFSIGAVTLHAGPSDLDDLMKRADAEMYRAKNDGKDRTHHRVIGEEPALV